MSSSNPSKEQERTIVQMANDKHNLRQIAQKLEKKMNEVSRWMREDKLPEDVVVKIRINSMRKPELVSQAADLIEKGYHVTRIAGKLDVSDQTIRSWVQKGILTKSQKEKLKQNGIASKSAAIASLKKKTSFDVYHRHV